MIYKIDEDLTYMGAYADNPNGYVPPNFTTIEPIGAVAGEYYFWNLGWIIKPSFVGTTYYRESNGELVIWEDDIAPTEGFQTVAPAIAYPTWDGTAWIENTALKHDTLIKALICDLPSGDIVVYKSRGEFINTLEQMNELGLVTAVIDEVTYHKNDIRYVCLWFEYRMQEIYNG